MQVKVYDAVLELLKNNPELRNSDRLLIWEFWRKEGFVKGDDGLFSNSRISKMDFLDATHPESIRRSAAEIRSLEREKLSQDPEYLDKGECLLGLKEIEAFRQIKAQNKGTYIFREKSNIYE